jgi:aminopeptidase N
MNAQLRTTNFLEDAAAAPRDHQLDFTKIKVALSFDAPKGIVIGKVIYQFSPLRPESIFLFLDGIKMQVKELAINGKPAKYSTDSAGITIIPNETLVWNVNYEMTISYEAKPRVGLYFIGWNDQNNLSRKQIWSQGEQIDNRNWIPMYDERNDKLLTEMSVTFDKEYKVLSNGKLADKQENPGWNHYLELCKSHPQSPYLIMLGTGKYDIKETQAGSGAANAFNIMILKWKDRCGDRYINIVKQCLIFSKKRSE